MVTVTEDGLVMATEGRLVMVTEGGSEVATEGGSEVATEGGSEMVGGPEAVVADSSERAMVDGSDAATVDMVMADGLGEERPVTAIGSVTSGGSVASGVGGLTTENGVEMADRRSDSKPEVSVGGDVFIEGGMVLSPGPTMGCHAVISKKWKATLIANTQRMMMDDNREDNGWIWWEEKKTLRTSLPTMSRIYSTAGTTDM